VLLISRRIKGIQPLTDQNRALRYTSLPLSFPDFGRERLTDVGQHEIDKHLSLIPG